MTRGKVIGSGWINKDNKHPSTRNMMPEHQLSDCQRHSNTENLEQGNMLEYYTLIQIVLKDFKNNTECHSVMAALLLLLNLSQLDAV